MATERLSLRIDADLKKRLEREAQAEKRAAVRATVSEADEGAFISQEAMDAWISSWGKASKLPPPKPDIHIVSTDR